MSTIDAPEGLSELESNYWEYFDFLLSQHWNPPRGYSDTASYVIARYLRECWPKGVAWGDLILWMRSSRLPRPFDRRCIEVMTRYEYEKRNP